MAIAENTALWYFFKGYTGAALWSSHDDDGQPLDDGRDDSDIAESTLATMESDCRAFYAAQTANIHCEGAPLASDFEGPIAFREAAQAGYDFWMTRTGTGVGFWDGDWPEPAATVLDQASEALGNVELYIGDDGKIYA